MSAKNQLTRVRVVGDVGGDAPEWARKAWEGLELNAKPFDCHAQCTSVVAREHCTMDNGWMVEPAEALQALANTDRTEVHQWWSMVKMGPEQILAFATESCVPVAA